MTLCNALAMGFFGLPLACLAVDIVCALVGIQR